MSHSCNCALHHLSVRGVTQSNQCDFIRTKQTKLYAVPVLEEFYYFVVRKGKNYTFCYVLTLLVYNAHIRRSIPSGCHK